jgi:O-antigen ligase
MASFDRAALMRIADWLMVAVAASLPWSTSATSILLVLWLISAIPALQWQDVRGVLVRPAAYLPVLLFLLGALGVTWASVPWLARWHGLDSFFRLLLIPMLFVEFRGSGRGLWVFGAFLLSCVLLLIATDVVIALQPLSFIALQGDNVLVKNGTSQSGEFVTCIFGLLFLARDFVRRRQWIWLAAAAVIVLGMLSSMFFVSTGRTALVTIPVLLVLFAAKELDYRSAAILLAGAAVLGAVAWVSSPYLRERTVQIWVDYRHYEASDEQNSSGERLEFMKKSIGFVLQAPLIGHGTGSITELFKEAVVGKTGAQGSATTNPHNQTFAVAIQIGLVGALLLWAMWIAHALLFRGAGLADWIGLVVVVQNIVGSLFNSHLFDFVQGWTYIIGVGVAGGMVLKQEAAKGSSNTTP